MKTIHIDDAEYDELRRLLGRVFNLQGNLPEQAGSHPRWAYLIGHKASAIYPGRIHLSPEELADWIMGELRARPIPGRYNVPTAKRWTRVAAGSGALFHIHKEIVACGTVMRGFQFDSSEVGYQGYVTFDPTSLRRLSPAISFDDAEREIGVAINPRSIQQISYEQYTRVLSLGKLDASAA